MGHIFVSYSRHDLEMVDRMVGRIENAGMKVWIDRDDIKAGKTWRAQIVQAIDTCDAFVLMLSSNSAASDNVRKEIDLAQDSGRTVFMLRLDPVAKLPDEMRYQLVGLQYVDIQELGEEVAVKQLMDTIKEHLRTSKPDGEKPVREAELVIQGVDPSTFGTEKQEQLINFVSELTETPDSQLHITKLTAGSIHVFVDMPARAAFDLKTRALNRDHHFKRLGIKSLRLVGNKRYINISLGILTTTATIGFLKLLWMSIPSLFPSIVGVTAGKVIVITSTIAVTTAVGLTVSQAVAATLNPTPVPAFAAIPTHIPTATQTPASRNLLVIQDALCQTGPGPAYDVVSSVLAGTRVELLGRGDLLGWWVISNPRYHTPCWIQESFLQIDPSAFPDLPIYTPLPPLPRPTSESNPSSDSQTQTQNNNNNSNNNNIICLWWNGRRICIPRLIIPTGIPAPPPPN